MKALFGILGFVVMGLLVMILVGGTRKGERKAKLSSEDFSVLNEIALEPDVLDATITNVRVLYVVADGSVTHTSPKDEAERYCEITSRKDALVELVRVVSVDNTMQEPEGKPRFSVLAECNCSPIRVR